MRKFFVRWVSRLGWLGKVRSVFGSSALRLAGVLTGCTGIAWMALSHVHVSNQPIRPTVRQPVLRPLPLKISDVVQVQSKTVDVGNHRSVFRDLGDAVNRTTFKLIVPVSPDEACAVFTTRHWVVQPWSAQPFGDGMECTAEQTYSRSGVTETSNAFAIVKGKVGRLTDVRVKLNLLRADDRTKAAADFVAVSAHLFKQWRLWESINMIEDLKALRPFKIKISGTSISFSKEYGDVARYNLAISFDVADEIEFLPAMLPSSESDAEWVLQNLIAPYSYHRTKEAANKSH